MDSFKVHNIVHSLQCNVITMNIYSGSMYVNISHHIQYTVESVLFRLHSQEVCISQQGASPSIDSITSCDGMGDLVDESVKRDLTTKGHTLWGRYPSSLFVSSLPSLYPNMIRLSCGLVLHGFILLVTQYCHGLSPGQQHEKSLGEPPRFGLGVCRTQTCEKTSVAIERGEQYLNALTQSSRQVCSENTFVSL